MITVRLYGGMGNQMWQIAACVGTALRNNTDYAIPHKTVDTRIWKTYFTFPRRIPMGGRIWREPTHAYTPIPNERNIILDGYFQSDKYFKGYEEQIYSLFGLNHIQIEGVAIHVRRGDYLKYPDKHPVLSVEYIHSAIEYFKHLGHRKFMFFSDDIQWCKDYFPAYEYSQGRTGKQDIEYMSCFQHQVLSASSFSAWGAMLNKNPDKIVIAPAQWFGVGNSHLDTKDMYCDGWIKMNQKGEFV